MSGSVCVVTVHGIGFQQPPLDGRPGYADALHANLRRQLGDRLGDDPDRASTGGPVYVESEWNHSPREGLARLDPGRPLAADGKIAHVALVYAPSEQLGDRPGSVADTLVRAAIAHNHYTSSLGSLRLLLSDAWAALHEHQPVSAESTLRPRGDLDFRQHHGVFAHLLHTRRQPEQPQAAASSSSSSPGAFDILRALEDDVATYVARNDLRERVRGFVELALLKLLDRPDTVALVVNAHSQGTVICWDVLCGLPFYTWIADGDRRARLVRTFVTAGSPIRKYVDMFAWGEEVGELAALTVPDDVGFSWQNFWDTHDPVADPLNPAASWRPGTPLDSNPDGDDGLLVAREPTGARHHVHVTDTPVDNIDNSSGGGLQAHDYWNNQSDFVTPLGKLLEDLQDA